MNLFSDLFKFDRTIKAYYTSDVSTNRCTRINAPNLLKPMNRAANPSLIGLLNRESSKHQHMGLNLHSEWQQQRHCLVTYLLPFPYYVAGGLDGTRLSQICCRGVKLEGKSHLNLLLLICSFHVNLCEVVRNAFYLPLNHWDNIRDNYSKWWCLYRACLSFKLGRELDFLYILYLISHTVIS